MFVSCEKKKDSYLEISEKIKDLKQSENSKKELEKLFIDINLIEVDSSRLSLLNKLFAKSNRYKFNQLSSLLLKKVDSSEIEKYDEINAKFLINKALYYRGIGSLDSSYYFYNEAKKKNESIKYIKGVLTSLYGLAEIEAKFNNYTSSELKLKKIIYYTKNSGNIKMHYISLITLGNNYMNEGNYKQSLIYHNKAYNFYLKNKESINIEFLHREVYLNNIGNVYKHLGKYKDAISLFKRALKTRSIIIKKDSELYGLLVSNLGFCLLKAGNYKDANAKFNLAEKIFKSINNKEELALVLIQKAELYSKLNNKQKSFLLGKESLKLSREAKALKCELYVLEKLIDFDNERLKNIRDYINLRNKIEFIDEKSRNTFYNIQLETNQIAQAKEKAETQRNQILLAIGILLLISGFLFIMY
ncbi:MAG: hypothetical protein RL607_1575, partial [Bacteroidota bacterium]